MAYTRPTRKNKSKADPKVVFLKAWSAFGQDLANFTNETTILVRDRRGMARFASEGWPLAGELVATFEPKREAA